jgi:hypothetical protein
MLYTVTLIDDRNNQKLRGQEWNEVSSLFQCDEHQYDADAECAVCVEHDEVLDALAMDGHYYAAGTVYSPYYGEMANWTTRVTKED